MTRRALHTAAVVHLRRRLAGMGFATESAPHSGSTPTGQPADFLVHGIACAVRVACPVVKTHAVTSRGKRYAYAYRFAHWNLHRHGHPARRPPGVWFLMIDGSEDVFVFSGGALQKRKSVAVLVDAQHARQRECPIRWALNNWAVLRRAA